MTHMPSPIDVNHMTVALRQEMVRGGQYDASSSDVVFLGGGTPSEGHADELAGFAQRKNYNIIFAACDAGSPDNVPTGYHVVITDGLNNTFALGGGRLWKRDRRAPSVLLFSVEQVIAKVSAKGRLVVRPMVGEYHEEGYDLAVRSLGARVATCPGHGAVMAPVGGLVIVLDVRQCAATFAAAA